jgi:hypothetical protein
MLHRVEGKRIAYLLPTACTGKLSGELARREKILREALAVFRSVTLSRPETSSSPNPWRMFTSSNLACCGRVLLLRQDRFHG